VNHYERKEMNQKEYDKIKEMNNVEILEEVKIPIHLTHQTDDFGNEIGSQQYTYQVTLKISM
tara:strand:- start:360 stop:545 length:186 start_codon:yes stop_codon:yes gene_type:complete